MEIDVQSVFLCTSSLIGTCQENKNAPTSPPCDLLQMYPPPVSTPIPSFFPYSPLYLCESWMPRSYENFPPSPLSYLCECVFCMCDVSCCLYNLVLAISSLRICWFWLWRLFRLSLFCREKKKLHTHRYVYLIWFLWSSRNRILVLWNNSVFSVCVCREICFSCEWRHVWKINGKKICPEEIPVNCLRRSTTKSVQEPENGRIFWGIFEIIPSPPEGSVMKGNGQPRYIRTPKSYINTLSKGLNLKLSPRRYLVPSNL